MYNWLQLAKILSKFYRKELKAAEGDATIISLPMLWAGSWYMNFQTKKYSNNDHEEAQNLRWKNQNSKTAVVALSLHTEQALGEQQMTEILTIF